MSLRAANRRAPLTPEMHSLFSSTIRGLAIDAIEAAKSGHPGMPLGAADFATVLWSQFLVHDPSQPSWHNRDRFVLSAGHGSMLLYGLLHLTGYELSLDDIQNFRQWGSKTPGHPEVGHTVGVEVTTGPLGTGFATGIGLALAERFLAARFNRPGFPVVDHYTYGIVSDGDLMEGVCAEAVSLAGHLGLGKIVYLYDDNNISIDGSTDITFTENVQARFEACGWYVERIDGHDAQAVGEAIERAKAQGQKPSLICCRTIIGKGSPNRQGTSGVHGAPLGGTEAAATKAALGLPADKPFYVPAEVDSYRTSALQELSVQRSAWDETFAAYRKAHPELAAQYTSEMAGELPANLWQGLADFQPGGKAMATRDAGQKILAHLAGTMPNLLGGSADLACSNKVVLPGTPGQSKEHPEGRNINFGVREHAMAAVCNGLALHGGLRPFTATFLIFSDFMRGALRLSSLMGLGVTHVFTHDSFWVGEDGPTHQPIEQIPSLRMIPGMQVVRPADARETIGAWKLALERKDGPTSLCLTRQNLPILETSRDDIAVGAYVIYQPAGAAAGDLDGILVATGSEVAAAIDAAKTLAGEGKLVRVVSMPCWEAFAAQPQSYRDEVLPPTLEKRLSVEAAATFGWERWAKYQLGINHFGASAPGEELAQRFGFTADAIASRYRQLA